MEGGWRNVDNWENGKCINMHPPYRKKLWLLAVKSRLPMKKSNVRFFHGEPLFLQNRAAPAEKRMSLIPPPSFHYPGATGATGASSAYSCA
jgi:hypothetical protein